MGVWLITLCFTGLLRFNQINALFSIKMEDHGIITLPIVTLVSLLTIAVTIVTASYSGGGSG